MRLHNRKLSLCLVAMLATTPLSLQAADPLVEFESPEQRARYDQMLEEYRCLKCQNQNLAGSNADLAGDLRREIRERILDGDDDQAIDHYLVSRYGDFVRYKPRFGGANLVLWLTPAALLIIGILAGVRLARNARAKTADATQITRNVDTDALDAARNLLSKSD